MPFYTGLSIRKSDSKVKRAEKKRVSKNILNLKEALHSHITSDSGDDAGELDSSQVLRLATWNIREFDSGKYGKRLNESLYYIAEIISHFDLIAIQEVKPDLTPLHKVMGILGPDWSYIATDASPGTKGNQERMVFIFNKRKTWFRKVAGEVTLAGSDRLTLPDTHHIVTPQGVRLKLPSGSNLISPASINTKTLRGKLKIEEAAVVDLPDGTQLTLPSNSKLVFGPGAVPELNADGTLALGSGRERKFSKAVSVRVPPKFIKTEALQFARTPFAVLFQSGWLKLMLCTVHIYYGKDSGPKLARRNAEIRTLTKALADRAKDEKDSDADSYFFVLGDFNIIGKEHATWDALHKNKFVVPKELKEIPEGSNVKRDKAYDQIAIWEGKTRRKQAFKVYTSVDIRRAGIFDFFKIVFKEGNDDPQGKDKALYTKIIAEEQPKFAKKKPIKKPWSYRTWRTYQMSDHLPMWIELRADFGDDYLQAIVDAE